MSRFELKSVVVESVEAFDPCKTCSGKGKVGHMIGHVEVCRVCQGSGGKWHVVSGMRLHEAVWLCEYNDGGGDVYRMERVNNEAVTKSSILVREHEVCLRCNGTKIEGSSFLHSRKPCDRCLKDADGKPTGAEPNTASQWRVKEVDHE